LRPIRLTRFTVSPRSCSARIGPRRAAPVRATARTDSRFEHGPLGVGQVHAVEYDGDHTAVSGGFRIYETASKSTIAQGLPHDILLEPIVLEQLKALVGSASENSNN
jgi:hypothetical protein